MSILFSLFTGTKHQKLQISEMADPAEFPESAAFTVDRNSASEFADGAVVVDALPNASRVRLSPRI